MNAASLSNSIVAIGILCLLTMNEALLGQERPAPAGVELQSLVQGVLDRADAITSAKLRYKRVIEISGRDEHDYEYTFTGSDWLFRSIGGGLEMSRGNKYLEYLIMPRPNEEKRPFWRYLFPQRTSGAGHTVSIGAARRRREEGMAVPIKIGTVWHDCTTAFIAKHSRETRLGEPQVFEGRRAYALEWDVSEEEVFHAFHSIDGISEHGGMLRVFVIPELGFVSPLIEHWGTKGRRQHTFTSSNFREVAPGLYFPMHWELQWNLVSGPGGREEFKIESIEYANMPVPAKEFIISLPIGTRVLDHLSNDGASFELAPDSPELQPLTDVIECVEPSPPWLAWGGTLGTGLVVLALFAVWSKRRLRRKKAGENGDGAKPASGIA